jgi:hypothetical protein
MNKLTKSKKAQVLKLAKGGKRCSKKPNSKDIAEKTGVAYHIVRKLIRGGSDKLNTTLRYLASGYTHFDKFKSLYIRDMSKEHSPILTIDDIKECLPYEPHTSNRNMGLHIGQRKLLLSEVQFLTKHNTPYCVYAGSAPGHKTHLLSNMFPDIKFILIDPNKFDLVLTNKNSKITHRNEPHPDIIHLYYEYPTKSNAYLNNKNMSNMNTSDCKKMVDFIQTSSFKVFIIEDYMNISIANMLKKLNCTFISDVRSNVDETAPSDFDIIWNTAMVYNWINKLQPEMTMIKFRIPYYNEVSDFDKYKHIYKTDFKIAKKSGIDFIQHYKDSVFKLSKCTLYIQAWKGSASTEMRGYIAKKDINNIITYDIKDIECKCYYYNKILRMCYHINNNANKNSHFCNCNDCAIENSIWVEYIDKINQTNSVDHYITMTNRVTYRPLYKIHNNTLYDIIDDDKLEQMSRLHNNSTMYKPNSTQKGNKGNV